ncbi:MAG: hypothetical protein ACFE95_20665 [Candidatus Hodarchaeota archaeon]
MNQQTVSIEKKEIKKRKAPKRTIGDNIRQIKYNLTTIRANLKFVFRALLRELKYFIPLQDLFILFLMIGLIIIGLLFLLIFGIPGILRLIPPEIIPSNNTFYWRNIQENVVEFVTNPTTIRWAAGIIGVGTVIVRLMIKSPIMKYRDKVNTKKDVTYIFGSSRPAELFLFEMIYQYGYEDKVSLIADADLLWVRKMKSMIDIYVVENYKEFEKENLYDIIGFKNAARVMVLTESIELNQNILTNIRRVRPDVDIILLSQYAPAFVFSELVQDKHLVIVEDLDATVQGLVTSLSLDFDFPPTAEIDVPRTFVGTIGSKMSSDIPKVDVLLIRRGEELLPPEETLKIGDRVILHYYSNYMMMLANRVTTELPLRPKKVKKQKKKKEDETETPFIPDDQIVLPTTEIPVITDKKVTDSTKISTPSIESSDEVN